jgi:hypothetical protein
MFAGLPSNLIKRVSTGVGLAVIAVALVISAGCSDKDDGVTNTTPTLPSGSLVGTVGCKTLEMDSPLDIVPVTSDCIMHRWDGLGTLRITHVNAGFNCCPGELSATITVEDGLILIEEAESEAACRCLCLFDMEYEITDLPPGEYTIRIVGLYTDEADSDLEVTVNLYTKPSGVTCVDRDYYPWDGGLVSESPYGVLVNMTDCKDFVDNGAIDVTPSNQDCVDYTYNDAGVLLLTHINAGFNCCPVINPVVTIAKNIITIEEIETEGLCDCSCLFDLDYEIRNLDPGTYFVRVIEPYLEAGDAKLEFTIDLETAPTGTYCVDRAHYPWGM